MKDKALIDEVNQINQMQAKLIEDMASNQIQMQKIARRAWEVQEKEHKKIALELHDSVGQLLTAAINQLVNAQQQDVTLDQEGLLALLKTALSETREMCRLMRPRILDDLGLLAALNWLVRTMSGKGDIQIELNHNINQPLSPEIESLFFRVVQESLTNVIKHAQASHAEVMLMTQPTLAVVKITDNGIGMPEGHDDGFGLSSMQDRVFAYGGQLKISSSESGGTQIWVTLDLVEQKAND